MKTRRTALTVWLVGLTASNFLWQAARDQDWLAAFDRSFAQALAVIFYAYWFAPKTPDTEKATDRRWI